VRPLPVHFMTTAFLLPHYLFVPRDTGNGNFTGICSIECFHGPPPMGNLPRTPRRKMSALRLVSAQHLPPFGCRLPTVSLTVFDLYEKGEQAQ